MTSQVSCTSVADHHIPVRVVGSVLGHEQQVLQYIEQQMLSDHIRLTTTSEASITALTIHFHRMKPRLPSDELAAILHASAGE